MTRRKKIALCVVPVVLVVAVLATIVLSIFEPFLPTWGYTVTYQSGDEVFNDGILLRSVVRPSMYFLYLPSSNQGGWWAIDFRNEMVFLPNSPDSFFGIRYRIWGTACIRITDGTKVDENWKWSVSADKATFNLRDFQCVVEFE